MRVFIMTMAFAMSSCATAPPAPEAKCPELPQITEQQTLKDYVLNLVHLYKECRNE